MKASRGCENLKTQANRCGKSVQQSRCSELGKRCRGGNLKGGVAGFQRAGDPRDIRKDVLDGGGSKFGRTLKRSPSSREGPEKLKRALGACTVKTL